MKTTAVTPAASAAVTLADDREASSHFLPTDRKYRMTGELPEDYEPEVAGTQVDQDADRTEKDGEQPSTNTEEQDGSEAAAAAGAGTGENGDEAGQGDGEGEQDGAGSGESAAASQAASSRERTEKTPATSESRWAKLSRENRELRQELAKRGGAAAQARDTSQASQPAAAAATPQGRPEPQIDDVDPKTGKPKYAAFTDYLSDVRKWDREQTALESKTNSQRAALEQATQAVNTAWGKKVEAATKSGKHKDFQEVALADDLPIKLGSPVDLFILQSDVGTDLLYSLGKNRAELDRINGLNPLLQVRELTKLEMKLTSAAPRTPAITTAAKPPHQASGTGKGTVTKDAVEKAVEEGDTESYMREQNRRALERRKPRGK